MTAGFDQSIHIYLVRGDSHRIVADAEAALVRDIRGDGEVELVVLDGAKDTASAITNALGQTYMFADYAIVCLREADQFATDQIDPLADFLSESHVHGLLENYLIISSYQGAINPKFNKLVTSIGSLIDCRLTDANSRRSFLNDELSKATFVFTSDAVAQIEAHVGEDVSLVRSLLEVLQSSFDAGSKISLDDVEPYLYRPGQRPLYTLTNSIESCKANGESFVLAELAMFVGDLGVHPLAIYSLISRRILEIAAIQANSINSDDEVNAALAQLGLKKKSPFAAKKLREAAQILGFDGVKKSLAWCAEAEASLKGVGGIPDKFALELLVARLSNLFSRKRSSSRPIASRR